MNRHKFLTSAAASIQSFYWFTTSYVITFEVGSGHYQFDLSGE